jgi:FeS assembly SUF system protein
METVMSRTFIEIKDDVVKAMQTIYDPEIPVNIFELGLIYEVNVDPANNVEIIMTLTAPNCPAAEILPEEVKDKAEEVEGVQSVNVEITFEPEWTMDNMSETAKLELGLL